MHLFARYFLTPILWLAIAATVISKPILASSSESNSNQQPPINTIPSKGKQLYHRDLANQKDIANWRMEGNAQLNFSDGWMEMFSPAQQQHHVLWCPQEFPDDFIASWEVQNLAPEAGLLIIFFAARGIEGQDIFDPSLPLRDGTFTDYTLGKIKSYHISYYANVAHEPGRVHANLRKNNTFSLLQSGGEGIPTHSTDVYQLTLIKERAHLRLFINERKVIDYVDNQPIVDGVNTGAALTAGKIGFRQMQWSRFRYRNFTVWELAQ